MRGTSLIVCVGNCLLLCGIPAARAQEPALARATASGAEIYLLEDRAANRADGDSRQSCVMRFGGTIQGAAAAGGSEVVDVQYRGPGDPDDDAADTIYCHARDALRLEALVFARLLDHSVKMSFDEKRAVADVRDAYASRLKSSGRLKLGQTFRLAAAAEHFPVRLVVPRDGRLLAESCELKIGNELQIDSFSSNGKRALAVYHAPFQASEPRYCPDGSIIFVNVELLTQLTKSRAKWTLPHGRIGERFENTSTKLFQ